MVKGHLTSLFYMGTVLIPLLLTGQSMSLNSISFCCFCILLQLSKLCSTTPSVSFRVLCGGDLRYFFPYLCAGNFDTTLLLILCAFK